jgi:hypothetical protein
MTEKPSSKRDTLPAWLLILALALLALVTFGVWLPKLGFYWDDWAKILVNRIWGPQAYWAYYAEDRPLSAWTHILLTPLLGESPLGWQVFALLMRLLSAGCVGWLLGSLWPQAKRQAVIATLLFFVYPIFNQQAIALTFHQQWLQSALITLSLALMVQAFRRPRYQVWLSLASLLTALLQLSITEYYVGLELIRLPILWILTQQQEPSRGRRIKTTLLRWLPYVLLLAAFIIWRMFFVQLTGDDPYKANLLYRFTTSPLGALLDLAKWIISDTLQVLLVCWANVLNIGLALNLPSRTLLVWLAGIATAAAAGFFIYKYQTSDPESKKSWYWQALLLGLLGVLAGCLPAWVTERRIIEDYHANRYAMPAMLGAALVWTVAVEWIGRSKLQKAALAGALIGLTLIFHWNTAREYAEIWQNQLDFYWQLSWRAPDISADTAILSEYELFPNQGSFSTSAAINQMYPQDDITSETLDYFIFPMNPRFANNYAYENPIGIPLKTQFRTLKFEGQTPHSFIVYYEPERADCLWILSPQDVDNPLLPALTKAMLPASNVQRILAEDAGENYPPVDMIGAEPAHGFCYLYQKTALALQVGDTEQAVELASQAWAEYQPTDEAYKTPHEWITFVRAYASAGRWEDAADLTIEARAIRPGEYYRYLCSVWQQMDAEAPASAEKDAAYAHVQDELTCQSFE